MYFRKLSSAPAAGPDDDNAPLQGGRGLQPVDFVRVCVCDFGQSCDTFGEQLPKEFSFDKGATLIRAPECFLACKGKKSKPQPIGYASDVWAVGVNHLLMVGGRSAVLSGSSTTSIYIKYWIDIIGAVPCETAQRLGWVVMNEGVSDGWFKKCNIRTIRPVAGGSINRTHSCILKWDPHRRPMAREIADSGDLVPDTGCSRRWLARLQPEQDYDRINRP